MSLLLVMTLLAQTHDPTPSKDHTRALSLAKPEPETFVVTPKTDWAHGATKRFVGAFLGGLVGLAIPAAIAAVAAPQCMIGLCAFATGAGLLSVFSGPLSVVGATAGFTLMGGRMSGGAAVAGAFGGLVSGLLLLLISGVTTGLPNESQWGAVIAAGAITVALEALALEARSDALDEAPFLEVDTSRLVFSSLGMLATVGAGVGLAALTLLTGYLSLLLAPIVLVATAAIAPIIPWSIHRGMGGEGSLGAAYLGWLASLAVGTAGVVAAFLGATMAISTIEVDARSVALVGGGIGLAVIAGVMGTPLMLEWSHGEGRLARAKPALGVKAQVSVAPIANQQGLAGGALALTGTF